MEYIKSKLSDDLAKRLSEAKQGNQYLLRLNNIKPIKI